MHFDRGAKEFMAKEACGATNSTMFPFNRPRRRAVRDFEELCTSSPMSSLRTRVARAESRMWAFLEGQTVVANWEKFPPWR